MENHPEIPITDLTDERPASHEGHRRRMHQRYRKGGLAAFEEHEVLEMLLFRSIPRSNTNPLAHSLLETHGSLEAVLLAAEEGKIATPGVGEKTRQMLAEAKTGMTESFQKSLMNLPSMGRSPFYTAAVRVLRHSPERIFLLLCTPGGRPLEAGSIGKTEPAEILESLRRYTEPGMLCHMACMGRETELADLRKSTAGVRLGMLLSLNAQWVPQWQ